MPHGTDSRMWLPDVAIVTASSFYELARSDLYPIRLHSDGKVEFQPGGFIRFNCKINLKLFPFDSMDCLARIESWFYNSYRQLFDKSIKDSIGIYNFTEHEQWILDDMSFHYEDVFYENMYGGENFTAINYRILLNRKSAYYLVNVLIPSLLLSTLQLITFVLPPNETVRIELSFICLLAYTMFQSVIQADLPKSADQTPLLSIFITLMIAYIALAIACQCMVVSMTDKAVLGLNVPNWLYQIFKSRIVHDVTDGLETTHTEIHDEAENDENFLGIQDKHHTNHIPELETRKKRQNSKFWEYLFTALDRTSCILYFLLLFFTIIVMLVLIPTFSPNELEN